MVNIKLKSYGVDDVLVYVVDKINAALDTTSKRIAREHLRDAIGSLNALQQLVDIDEEEDDG